MQTVTSLDGTQIAFDQLGSGRPLIIVSGALCNRRSDGALADALATDATVLNYDRRGRGDSTDTAPYAVAREVEDLRVMVDAAGGSAALVGLSSGGALALRAAAAIGPAVTHVVAWEVPYRTELEGLTTWAAYRRDLGRLVAAGRTGDALALFLRLVGTPEQALALMQTSPWWAQGEQIAPTLAYDAAVLGDCAVPAADLAAITCPVLLLTGGGVPARRSSRQAHAPLMPRSAARRAMCWPARRTT